MEEYEIDLEHMVQFIKSRAYQVGLMVDEPMIRLLLGIEYEYLTWHYGEYDDD